MCTHVVLVHGVLVNVYVCELQCVCASMCLFMLMCDLSHEPHVMQNTVTEKQLRLCSW